MQTDTANISTKEYEVVKTLDFYRGMLLDYFELKFGEREDWRQIRSQVLKIMGNNGLEQKLKEIINK